MSRLQPTPWDLSNITTKVKQNKKIDTAKSMQNKKHFTAKSMQNKKI